MLATRIIPVVLYNGNQAVKSVRFRDHRNIGSTIQVARVYELRQVDEIVFLDIYARNGGGPDFRTIESFARELSCPFTVGGGIRSVGDAKTILDCGADKVAVGAGAEPDWLALVAEISSALGRQAVVASVDVILDRVRGAKRDYRWMIEQLTAAGAGEILLNAVDRDGVMAGYNTTLIAQACKSTNLPVIANSGAGKLEHFRSTIKAGASAVAASSIFQFTQITPSDVKGYLANQGVTVRA